MTLEEAFRLGAEAMRSDIAVRLMIHPAPWGLIAAPWVLGLPAPRFQIPERVEIAADPTATVCPRCKNSLALCDCFPPATE